MKDNGKIKDFTRQQKHLLQPEFVSFRDKKEQEINYISDYEVTLNDGRLIVIDVKGSRESTEEVARVKQKMFMYQEKNMPIYFIAKLPKFLGDEWVDITKGFDFESKLRNKYKNVHGKWQRNKTPNWTLLDWTKYFEFDNVGGLFFRWKATKKVKMKKRYKMKHLVIKYFDTFPQEKYYFDTKEEAIEFAKEKDKTSTIYEYEYKGKVSDEDR